MKKILLVFDEPNWCFHSHAKELKKRLVEYHIEMVTHCQNIPEMSKQYDLIYIMDPMPLPYGYPPSHKTILGLRNEFLYLEHPQGAIGLYNNGFPGRCVSIKDKCSILHMVNKNQMNVFKYIVQDKPLFLAQHGIDEDLFDQNKYQREPHDGLFASVSGRGSSNKGFEIIVDACKQCGINVLQAQYGRHKLGKEQMPLFYNKVDIHICMSKTEGLSNPIMEAGAMGVPVISTKSGAAEEMIRNGDNGFLIERNKDSLIQALEKIKDKELRLSMGNKFYDEITKNWTWKVRIEDFRKMFGAFFVKKG